MASSPWFYRKRFGLSVIVWPANLKGLAFCVGWAAAVFGAPHLTGPNIIVIILGAAIWLVVCFGKSEEVPRDW